MLVLKYEAILKDPEAPGHLKELTRLVQKNGGTTVGTWLKNSSTSDLLSVSHSALTMFTTDPNNPNKLGKIPESVPRFFVVLADVLSSAEGLDLTNSSASMATRLKLLDSYVSLEILKRKGFDIDLNYDTLTLNEDMSDGGSTGILKVTDKLEAQIDDMMNQALKIISSLPEEKPAEPVPPVDPTKPSLRSVITGISMWLKNYKRDKPTGPVES